MPLAVEGFFRNGGTTAFVLRVGTGSPARAELSTAGAPGTLLARLHAVEEGAAGEGGSVTVTHTSALADALTAAGAGGFEKELALKRIWQIAPGRADEPGVVYCGVDPSSLFVQDINMVGYVFAEFVKVTRYSFDKGTSYFGPIKSFPKNTV